MNKSLGSRIDESHLVVGQLYYVRYLRCELLVEYEEDAGVDGKRFLIKRGTIRDGTGKSLGSGQSITIPPGEGEYRELKGL